MSLADRSPIDPRIARWFAQLLLNDDDARWIDAGGENVSSLSEMACTLQARPMREPEAEALRLLQRLASPTDSSTRDEVPRREGRYESAPSKLALVVAGPGMGKSTTTTLLAQLLRTQWVKRDAIDGKTKESERLGAVLDRVSALRRREEAQQLVDAVPLRVSLPHYVRWAAREGRSDSVDALWAYLASEITVD